MKYRLLVLTAVVLLLPFYRADAQKPLPPEIVAYADSILYNGKILTADAEFSSAQAVAIRDGKFIAVGTSDRILDMAGPQTHKIDLEGKEVIPGIIDLHQHPFTAGMYQWWGNKYLPGEPPWNTAEDALNGIKRAVGWVKPGEMVIINRSSLQQRLKGVGGGRGLNICEAFTLAQLDAVSPNNPVFLMGIVNLSAFAANSKAAKILKQYVQPADATLFYKAGKSCIASGADVDGSLPPAVQAVNDYIYWALPLEEQMTAYRMATHNISAKGITLTKEHTAGPLLGGIRELWARGELTVRMRMPYPLTPLESGMTVEIAPDRADVLFRRIGNLSGIGDDMLRLVAIRPPAIGGNVQGGDAWTFFAKSNPYPDRWGNASPHGGRIQEQEPKAGEVFRGRTAIVNAVRFGWDVSADHTVGDRAVAEILKAFKEGLDTQIVKRPGQRLTISHTPMARLEDLDLMKKMGVYVSIGPWHLYDKNNLEGGLMAYGAERLNTLMPMRSYITRDLKPALEGDVDVPVFWRIEKAVTRKDDFYGRVINAKEAVTREEAMWMSTIWPATQLGEEKKLGSIEPGKLADLVILDKDYMTVPPDEIHALKPLLTMVGGKVVFEADSKSGN